MDKIIEKKQKEQECSDGNIDKNRRDFVVLTASSVAAIGVCCAAWPLIDSMNPSKDVLALSSIEVDLSEIKIGETKIVNWRGKPVFIKHRTPEEI